jgi:hypothetical protein
MKGADRAEEITKGIEVRSVLALRTLGRDDRDFDDAPPPGGEGERISYPYSPLPTQNE